MCSQTRGVGQIVGDRHEKGHGALPVGFVALGGNTRLGDRRVFEPGGFDFGGIDVFSDTIKSLRRSNTLSPPSRESAPMSPV